MKTFIKRKLASACTRYLNYYNDYSYDFAKNGEEELLKRFSQFSPSVVFDVGANVGEWSRRAASAFGPRCRIHAFEMVPETHKRLVRATAGLCIEAVNAAIGESDGHIEFKQFATRDRLNTTVMRPKVWEDGLAVTRHNARCVAGDTYCKERGIEKIDLLKIDVEGAEQSVLRGFQSLLRDQKIRLIQFEYGYANGDERFLMRDFFEFFDGLGYKVARLRRRDIEFTPYRREYNNFTSGPNFIAIRNGDPELELALTS